MKDCEKTVHQIKAEIAAQLDGDAIIYWGGMSRQSQDEIAIEVQRHNATIDQACDTIRTWTDEAKMSSDC